jgi:hypothetical protein
MPRTHIHSHRPVKSEKPGWIEKSTESIPLPSRIALREAVDREGVSLSDFDDLLWIMAQESGGIVDARNGASTARGLFQLLQAQYELNPRGANSFGDAVEECQGGIRYIYGRYHSARHARAFWRSHHWY